jgi:hypothetical protein
MPSSSAFQAQDPDFAQRVRATALDNACGYAGFTLMAVVGRDIQH